MFDRIKAYMECPYCGNKNTLRAQTKDLNKILANYRPLRPDLDDMINREKLPVDPDFPQDKSHEKWSNQQEKINAQAKVPDQYTDIDHVRVSARCRSVECMFDSDREAILAQGTPTGGGKQFKGKIKVNENGYLTGKIVDIEKPDYYNKDLSKYKEKYPETFEKLKEQYNGHEPILVRNWPTTPIEEKQ